MKRYYLSRFNPPLPPLSKYNAFRAYWLMTQKPQNVKHFEYLARELEMMPAEFKDEARLCILV